MSDETTNARAETGPPPHNAPRPTGGTAARTGHIRLQLWRWVLTPRTTWQAHRLKAKFGPGMDTRTAWVMARLARHPDELQYAMRHLDNEENAG
ncbi:hypothetical protein [Streptomyces guryensis]|uniref:Uncharacterized protein n=1 Tax=Streptomyces guryensis TaxID=2886947 RepID=A0A9Q3Z6I4_9ACTN|nr:hypothetical protein [Streptomyces guryensis]MCD9875249.1 hypothetical protein [Streptomyces guryensis]